jgi:hypothetical protein
VNIAHVVESLEVWGGAEVLVAALCRLQRPAATTSRRAVCRAGSLPRARVRGIRVHIRCSLSD